MFFGGNSMLFLEPLLSTLYLCDLLCFEGNIQTASCPDANTPCDPFQKLRKEF